MKWRAAVLTGAVLMGNGLWGQGAGENYRPAAVSGATDVAFPPDSAVTGVVTLGVSVDGSGVVQNVTVIRDVPPLTAAAQEALKSWKFSPAVKDGKFVPGNVRVHIVFNPFNPGDTGVGGGSEPGATDGDSGDAEFQPAQLQTAEFAQYPENSVASGTVLVQLNVDAEGAVQGARVMRGAGPLAGAVTRTVKSWTFSPATYKGNAVRSVVPVAFVFASPAQGTQ
ncbi:MAG TPA: TonB family protein [Methylomirabilota bacterium]|nr:TonB family protein [Methylomirabilota bacterium]